MVSMLLLVALKGAPTQCGQSNFVTNRNMHKQRSHRLRHILRANGDQIEQSLPRVALASLRPEVLQVLPETADLDLRLHDDGVLDTSVLSSVDNPLGSLWLSTESVVDQYLANQPARRYEPDLVKNPANKLVLRLNSFLTKFIHKYVKVSKPANLDFYVQASSSVKVGNFSCSAWMDLQLHARCAAAHLEIFS